MRDLTILRTGSDHSPELLDENKRKDLQAKLDEMGPWFYDIDLPGGLETRSKVSGTHGGIHTTRRIMLEDTVAAHFGSRVSGIRAIDLGCHEGYFGFALRSLGVREVLGIDIRGDNLERARMIAELSQQGGSRFVIGDCENLENIVEGRFDLVLMFGLLYHQENPIRCLRQAATICSEMILVETQVVDEIEATAEWGRRDCVLPYHGHFAVIDESEFGSNVELGATPLALCPSPIALTTILRHLGFQRIETLTVPPGGNEQFTRGKRVIVAGWR